MIATRILCASQRAPAVLTSTTGYICDHVITRHIGLVQGSTVRTKHIGNDIFAAVKQIFGGELTAYTDLLREARAEAIERYLAFRPELSNLFRVHARFLNRCCSTGLQHGS